MHEEDDNIGGGGGYAGDGYHGYPRGDEFRRSPPPAGQPTDSGSLNADLNDLRKPRDRRLQSEEQFEYSMYDSVDSRGAAETGRGDRAEEEEGGRGIGFGSRLAQRPPKTNQDAADAAGAGVMAALMEVRNQGRCEE